MTVLNFYSYIIIYSGGKATTPDEVVRNILAYWIQQMATLPKPAGVAHALLGVPATSNSSNRCE